MSVQDEMDQSEECAVLDIVFLGMQKINSNTEYPLYLDRKTKTSFLKRPNETLAKTVRMTREKYGIYTYPAWCPDCGETAILKYPIKYGEDKVKCFECGTVWLRKELAKKSEI